METETLCDQEIASTMKIVGRVDTASGAIPEPCKNPPGYNIVLGEGKSFSDYSG